MLFKDIAIKKKLVLVNLMTSGVVLVITCVALFAYEFHTFRQSMIKRLSTLGEITAANSTAALAFDDVEAAEEILATLQAEEDIVAAILYDTAGQPFAYYPENLISEEFQRSRNFINYRFGDDHLEGFQPVIQGNDQLGALYLRSNLRAMETRFMLYSLVLLFVIAISIVIAYVLSRYLSRSISDPIISLSDTATAISHRQDYSVRAVKQGNDELGVLTDAFNQMLVQIQANNETLSKFNKSLEQKVIERTRELEIALKEQKEAEREVYDKNQELSLALDKLKIKEEQLINLNDELEQRVDARTKELLQSGNDLQAKNLELEKVNIDLDNFIYTASHDLKSPIANLEGLLEVVKEESVHQASATQWHFLEMMDTSISKLKGTILDLAEITKVQKNLEENAEQVFFEQIIEDVKGDIMYGTKASMVTIESELEVPHIIYPVQGLRSVLYNLLSNAVKYRSNERPVVIKVKTYMENGVVVLVVEDNGLGIEERHHSQLFSMFKRFHSHVEGTGIGLYIIKRIVENQGGRIEYISKGAQGSIFKVYLQ